MSWKPTTDFEEEIVDLQPDHNFIFGELTEKSSEVCYPRPKAHLEYAALQKKQRNEQENTLTSSQNHKLNVIAKVQRIAGTKPLGEQPTIDDWNDDEHVERETIAMIRHFGFGPSIEEPLDEARTIPTHPIKDDMKIMQNGRKRLPIFFDEKFFKLKPRTPTAINFEDFDEPKDSNNASPTDSASSEKSNSDKSSDKKGLSENSRYESALGDNVTDAHNNDDSFASASNNENAIRTQVWYNKNKRAQNNVKRNDPNAGASSDNQHHKNLSHPRFYTAKELYEKKRQK